MPVSHAKEFLNSVYTKALFLNTFPQNFEQLFPTHAKFFQKKFGLKALQNFDYEVRFCFEQSTGIHSTDLQWSKASLSTRNGGLGFRKSVEHSYAAYLASATTFQRNAKWLAFGKTKGCQTS